MPTKAEAMREEHPAWFDNEGNPVPAVEKVDMVNAPPHYTRGPKITCPNCGDIRTLEHIEVFRYITDSRLATAFKYIWRVAFGGKKDDIEDLHKSIFYVQDFLEHPLD